MENLTIKATKQTPEIDFSHEGFLKIDGRAYPEDASAFFTPLIDFVNDLRTSSVTLDVNLEYINTASSKKLLHLLQLLDDMQNINSVKVNWHYEEGDEDSVETAEIYEESLDRIQFTYSEYADACL